MLDSSGCTNLRSFFMSFSRPTALVTLFFALTCYLQSTMYTKSACIIIHGTWAKDESWYKPEGDFFKALQSSALELKIVDEIISFQWSGKLGHSSQLSAAQNLEKIISMYDWVILVGHSHGVTVGILASTILAKNISNGRDRFKIKKFYALGVPVDTTGAIFPDMSVIGTFYNLFSFGDYVQTVNLVHDRCFVCCERMVNISVLLQSQHPTHSDLHHPCIAQHLLKIEHYFSEKKLGNFENFSLKLPGIIYFYEYELPRYEIDHDQKRLLELDKKVHWLVTMAFFKNRRNND